MKMNLTKTAGFTLIEVTLALGVASFCLMTIFSLLPIGLNTNQNASEQTMAAGIATAISADLQGTAIPKPFTSGTPTVSPKFNIPVPLIQPGSNSQTETLYLTQDGNMVGAVNPSTPPASSGSPLRYQATVYVNPIPAAANKTVPVRILVTWPALASPSAAAGSFETMSSLNCN